MNINFNVNDFNVNIHARVDAFVHVINEDAHAHKPRLHWTFGPVSEQNLSGPAKGNTMATLVLKDTQRASGSVTLQDAKGEPATLPDGAAIAWTGSDDAVIEVSDNGDGSADVIAGEPGTAQVSVTVTGADGTTVLASGTADVQVVAGDVAAVAVSFGTPTEQE